MSGKMKEQNSQLLIMEKQFNQQKLSYEERIRDYQSVLNDLKKSKEYSETELKEFTVIIQSKTEEVTLLAKKNNEYQE